MFYFYFKMSLRKSYILPIHLLKLGSHFLRWLILVLILPQFFKKVKPFSKIFPHKLSEIFLILESTLTSFSNLKIFRNLSWFFQQKELWKNGLSFTLKNSLRSCLIFKKLIIFILSKTYFYKKGQFFTAPKSIYIYSHQKFLSF